ncbi:MAG: Crp/Fnr family transcriptional regulator [Candidatus Latescibacteria bacterium]|nr:Crp/Fnr family transcriptional regulator [Candidatus Latescibacterota bacterium]
MPNTVTSRRAPTGGKRGVLAKVPFFSQAPPDLQSAIAAEASVVHLKAGEYFLREGDSCAHFAILVSGKMRVFKLGERGHEITLYHVGPGEVCPLNVSCILSDRPVPAMAMVEEDVEAVVVPADTFRRLIAAHEPLRSFVFQMFSHRLAEVMSLVEEVAFRRMDQRLARRLEELLARDGGPQRTVETTHAEIAADLGTAREVVSRLLKEFERLRAVSLSRGRITLRDASVLRGLASGAERR